MPDVIEEFEGASVVGIEYEVRGISGGLQDPAKFNPRHFDRGEDGYLVLHVVHRAPRFDPVSKEDLRGDCVRVQILDVTEGTFVDEDAVMDAMKRQREINIEGRRQEEMEKGIQSFDLGAGGGTADGDESDEFVFARNHAAGTHEDNPVPGCPVCLKEGRVDEDGNIVTMAPAAAGDPPPPTPIGKGRGRKKDEAAGEAEPQ